MAAKRLGRNCLSWHFHKTVWPSLAISNVRRAFDADDEWTSVDLKAHFGCVNAIECSRDERLLASGGDDRRVLLWDLTEALTSHCTQKVPWKMKAEHNSNIFCVAFSRSDSLLMSGGNDGCIIVHDVHTGETKETYLMDEAVYSLSTDPNNEAIFVTASDDGQVLIYDIRSSEDPFCMTKVSEAMHCVQYNPLFPQYLATISTKSSAVLWDIRQTSRPVIAYKYSSTGSYSGMSLAFNQHGTRLFVIGRRMPPLIYDVSQEKPLHQFDHEGYYNACTIKSCCFVGPNCEYVAAGSDDFNVYLWKVPDETSAQKFIVRTACKVLKGHRSVVNQVRYNHQAAVLLSSGVEKLVKAWSPFPLSHRDLDVSQSHRDRTVYSHEQYIQLILRGSSFVAHNYTDESVEEDPKMIAFFDSLVQRELEVSTDTDMSEEASQRIYEFELSDSTDMSSAGSQSEVDNLSTSCCEDHSSSDSSRQLSPFSEAFISSVLAHERGDLPLEEESSQPEIPSSNVTMTDLVAKRRQQYLQHTLKLTERKMLRKRCFTASEKRSVNHQNDSSSSDSETENLSLLEKRKARYRKMKMRRIMRRITTACAESVPTASFNVTESGQVACSNQKVKLSALHKLRKTIETDEMAVTPNCADVSAGDRKPTSTTMNLTTPKSSTATNEGASTSYCEQLKEPQLSSHGQEAAGNVHENGMNIQPTAVFSKKKKGKGHFRKHEETSSD